MPNWCSNIITIKGDPSLLKKLDDQFKQEHEEYNIDIGEIIKVTGYSFNNFVKRTKKVYLKNWYRWSINNWGTKWDLAPNEIVTTYDYQNNALYYYFDTAWSPCGPVVLAMSKAFPDLTITHGYCEDGCQFAGVVEYHNGEEINREEADNDNFREFTKDHDLIDYVYTCEKCGCPLYEYEVDDEEPCPKCEHINKGDVIMTDLEILKNFKDLVDKTYEEAKANASSNIGKEISNIVSEASEMLFLSKNITMKEKYSDIVSDIDAMVEESHPTVELTDEDYDLLINAILNYDHGDYNNYILDLIEKNVLNKKGE